MNNIIKSKNLIVTAALVHALVGTWARHNSELDKRLGLSVSTSTLVDADSLDAVYDVNEIVGGAEMIDSYIVSSNFINFTMLFGDDKKPVSLSLYREPGVRYFTAFISGEPELVDIVTERGWVDSINAFKNFLRVAFGEQVERSFHAIVDHTAMTDAFEFDVAHLPTEAGVIAAALTKKTEEEALITLNHDLDAYYGGMYTPDGLSQEAREQVKARNNAWTESVQAAREEIPNNQQKPNGEESVLEDVNPNFEAFKAWCATNKKSIIAGGVSFICGVAVGVIINR